MSDSAHVFPFRYNFAAVTADLVVWSLNSIIGHWKETILPIGEDVKFLKNNDDVTKWAQTKKYNIIKKSQSPGSQN